MHIFNRSPKKSEIAKILESQNPVNTAKLESSAIARAAFTAMPSVLKYFLFFVLCFTTLLFLSAGLISLGATQNNYIYTTSGAIGAVLSIGILLLLFMKSIDDKKVTLQVVKDGLSELQALSTHLTAYLETVDKRTNRFFHCVTTSKITTYYLLNQLQDVLEKSVQQLHAVVERRSRQAIGEALCLFQGTLTISDGLIAEAGQTHEVQVYNLKAILSELQEKMEAGIEEIEAEIISFRNTPE